MKKGLLLLLLVSSVFAYGQQGTKADQDREKKFQEQAAKGVDTTKKLGWNPSAVAGLNLTQASFKDWVAGGENSLAYNVWMAAQFLHLAEKTEWSNSLRLTFGQARLGNKGLRKTDDEIYFESLLIYRLGEVINPYAALTFRSQFAAGYDYPSETTRVQTSKFLDPAYLTQSAGVAFQISPVITTRFGVGLREKLANTFAPIWTDDPTTAKLEKARIDGGLESVTSVEWPFAENMKYSSRLELFDPFKTLDEVYMRWDNLLAAKVNKYVSVSFQLQMLQDVQVTRRTQMKEMLALGISYTLL